MTKTVLLDETAFLIALLPKREKKADFCASRFEDVSALSDVTLAVRLPVVNSARRKVHVACALAERLFPLYESLSEDPSVAGFYDFVRHLSRRISFPQLGEALIRVLACCRLLSGAWVSTGVGPEGQYKELKTGFMSLWDRARSEDWLERAEVLVEPHTSTSCSSNITKCPRRTLLRSFIEGWGHGLLRQVRSFLQEVEGNLRRMVGGAGQRLGLRLSDNIRGNLVGRIRTMVRCCDFLRRLAPGDELLRALAEWAWQEWEAVRGVVPILRLYQELSSSSSVAACECHRWEAATTLAVGTMRMWAQRESAPSAGYEGADALLSFDRRLQFVKLLRARPAEPIGVECRRDFRIALAGTIDLRIDGQWHEVALISINLREKGLAVERDDWGVVPYGDALLARCTRFDDPRPYVPLCASPKEGVRLRSLSDPGEDPIQAFVGGAV